MMFGRRSELAKLDDCFFFATNAVLLRTRLWICFGFRPVTLAEIRIRLAENAEALGAAFEDFR